ncbi:MAG: tetratricopeptide repeat protein [Nostocaceae cyanobacterium]|nr:tetratricopeptide repeat protein [Nostocaceae cyanobacterium]
MLGNTLVGRYQIISHLGGGGFGETFVACDTQLPGTPECVVKKLKPQSNDPVTLQTARRLFDTEAQVLYKLGNHDRIPQLLAYFEDKEEFYLVQELIQGESLTEELKPGKILSESEVISLLQEILEILGFVHQQQVIHRDINPHNLLRREKDGKLILIDFGAVKQITTQAIIAEGTTTFTVAIGTPGYMPSEQAQGDPKFSSDIYAVGIIGIQAITGLSPHELVKDTNTNEIIWQNQAQVSQDFAKFLDKMVCYDFRQRYSSAKEALNALKDLQKQNYGTVAVSPKGLPKQVNYPQKSIIPAVIGSLVAIGLTAIASVFIIKTININHANQLYKEANILAELQHKQKALETYEKAIELNPDYAEAWNGKGKILYDLNQYKSALAAYDKAIQIEPEYLDAWIGRGFTLHKLQRYQEANFSFDKVLQQENNYPEIWNTKGDALINLKQYDAAIKAYDQAITLQPDSYQTWYKKGLALQNLRLYDNALDAYKQALRIKPNYEQAWYNTGNTLVNLRRYNKALSAYEKAVLYNPRNIPALLARSNILVTLQRYPEAVDSFKEVIKYNSKSYEAWYGLGWCLHQTQRYEQAVSSYEKAIAFKPRDYKAWYNKGNSLYKLEKYNDALTAYNKALRYNKDYYQAWYSKGNALVKLQRYQEAIASYEQAIKFKPDYREAIKARKQADKILSYRNSQKK